jgi:adenosylcobinamide kinase/adenosylcobinamide-phosphate guanylyltransferase
MSMNDKKIILLLGGARSGKSTYAQELAEKSGDKVLFVGTAEPLDNEMRSRIEAHKKARPQNWQTLEAPCNLGAELKKQTGDFNVVLIDCITLLVSNLLGSRPDSMKTDRRVQEEITQLIECIQSMDKTVIIVSNEVGTGLVPPNKLGRLYRDLLGKANQMLAQHANEVYLMVAGIPLKVK